MQSVRGRIAAQALAWLLALLGAATVALAAPGSGPVVEPLSPLIEGWNLTVLPGGGYTLTLTLREPPPCNGSTVRVLRDSTQDITPLLHVELSGLNISVTAGSNLLTRLSPGHSHLITLCNKSIARVAWPAPAHGSGEEQEPQASDGGETLEEAPPAPVEEDIGVTPVGEGDRGLRVGFNPRTLDLLPVLTSIAALVSAVVEYARGG